MSHALPPVTGPINHGQMVPGAGLGASITATMSGAVRELRGEASAGR
jgi:hypothetical protein